MSIKFLGVQIANGYSPEAHVFASLLAHCDPAALDAHVVHHQWPGDKESLSRFGAAAGISPTPLDFGWRSVAASRPLRQKIFSRVRFQRSLPRALALARSINPDVVYSSQQFWDCQAATYIARRLRRPQVIHLHYTIGPWLHRPVLNRLRTCAQVIAISDFIRRQALDHGVPEERVATIRNTVAVPLPTPPEIRADVKKDLGLPFEAPVIGIVARLDPDKGQADALRAFASLSDAHRNARLLIVGAPTPWLIGYENELRVLATELGVAERVHFLGRRPDVPRLLAALDVFIHPSRSEPFGLAVAEASAAGLPVVAYSEGATPEIVCHGTTGLLASPGDIAALAEYLNTLMDSKVAAQRMGRAGCRKMETEFRPIEAGHRFSECIQKLSGTQTSC